MITATTSSGCGHNVSKVGEYNINKEYDSNKFNWNWTSNLLFRCGLCNKLQCVHNCVDKLDGSIDSGQMVVVFAHNLLWSFHWFDIWSALAKDNQNCTHTPNNKNKSNSMTNQQIQFATNKKQQQHKSRKTNGWFVCLLWMMMIPVNILKGKGRRTQYSSTQMNGFCWLGQCSSRELAKSTRPNSLNFNKGTSLCKLD